MVLQRSSEKFPTLALNKVTVKACQYSDFLTKFCGYTIIHFLFQSFIAWIFNILATVFYCCFFKLSI